MVKRMAENCFDAAAAAPPLLSLQPADGRPAGVISAATAARATSVTVIGGAVGARARPGTP